MVAEIAKVVRYCTRTCAKNHLRLVKKMSPMKLLPATTPLESVAIDILATLLSSTRQFRFVLVISGGVNNMTQAVPIRCITPYDVAVVFVEKWVFKYGPPRTLPSDNGSKFVARFFQIV